MPVQTENIPESDKEKLEDISQQIKIDGETINMQLIERLAAKLGTSNDEVVLQLQKEGNQIPQEVLDETIEAGSKKGQRTHEPEGESFYQDLLDIFVDKDKDKDESLLQAAQDLASLIGSVLFNNEDDKKTIESGNYDKIAEIDKDKIIATNQDGTQFTRQSFVRADILNDIKNGELPEVVDEKVAKSKIHVSDIAEKRKVIIRGEKQDAKVTVEQKNQEDMVESLTNSTSFAQQKEAIDLHNKGNKKMGGESLVGQKDAVSSELKDIFAEMRKRKEEKQENTDNNEKPSTSCSAKGFEKANGEKSFAADAMMKQGIERDRGGNVAAAA